LSLGNLAKGTYRWRVATQSLVVQSRVDTFSDLKLNTRERGQWSDAETFIVVALPESPSTQPSTEDKKAIVLRWLDQKAARYDIQLSRTDRFDGAQSEVVTHFSDKPSMTLKNLGYGEHFLRYRAIERDGFVGGWSRTTKMDVPVDWTKLLMYLGGAIVLWP
jgi:hypothetical protein